MKATLCIIIVAASLSSIGALDPQSTQNVWQTRNSSRPWQNPNWTSSSSPPSNDPITQRSPILGQDSGWPSLSGNRQQVPQEAHTTPKLSYSNVVSPVNQHVQGSISSTPSPQHPSNQNGPRASQRRHHSQQRPVSSAMTINKTRPTDTELMTLSEKLFTDDNSNTGSKIRLNFQSRTQSNSLTDAASEPLLSLDAEVFQIPTIKALRDLYDNYIADTSFVESVTAAERKEESDFLNKILETTIMKETMEFLSEKGFVQSGNKAQKDLLNSIWFTMYSRGGGIIGSSAFEHVFMGELKKDEVSGLHNWIYFAHEEEQKRADYMGYLKKLELGKRSNLLKVHYRWSNVIKPSGSMFVGTSPELEMALYTVCFLTRPDDRCPLSLGGKTFGIQTYTYRLRGNKGSVIGSAYPVF